LHKDVTKMTTLTGHYFGHYERTIRSKLTEYADKDNVRVKNGTFRAELNETLSERLIDNLVWNLEHTWHAISVRRT
jgi:hypothetical protein